MSSTPSTVHRTPDIDLTKTSSLCAYHVNPSRSPSATAPGDLHRRRRNPDRSTY